MVAGSCLITILKSDVTRRLIEIVQMVKSDVDSDERYT